MTDRINVLDKGWIELQDVMGNDLAIVNAARTSFLGESKGTEADKKLLFYLMEHQHLTPFEMVEFKFRVKAPLIVWWQWVRHRTFSFNFQSARYMEMPDEFYLPDTWRLQSQTNKQGSYGSVPSFTGGLLSGLLDDHYKASYALYQFALGGGVAKEQARLFLPGFGIYYTAVAKTDARNLMHFLSLRMADEAQYEIRVYAQAMYDNFFKPTLPWTAEAFETWEMDH